jgi:hypothetical protein
VVGVYGDDGRFVPGRAAKWKAGEELMARMESVDVQGVEVGGGGVVSEADGVEAVGEKEEGGSILYGNNQNHLQIDRPVTDQDNPTETTVATNSTPTTPEPRQSTSFMNFLDDFGLWVPLPRPRFAGYSTGQYRMAA